MSYSKAKIYSLAASALLLNKEFDNVETDKSNECRVFNIHWDIALESTLKDLDLDHLSSTVELELIEELSDGGPWTYVYKYPSNCAFLRRIVSNAVVDNSRTHISKKVKMYSSSQKGIYTNEYQAVAEYIPKNISLASLSTMAGLALAYKLAYLSAPLVVGKGAKVLRDELQKAYILAKTEAQEDDANESFSYESEDIRSEFVAARLE